MKKFVISLLLFVVAISIYSTNRTAKGFVGEYYHKLKGDAYAIGYYIDDYNEEHPDELFNMGVTGWLVDKEENFYISVEKIKPDTHQMIDNKLEEIVG